ncbi:MAG: hypothetical protein WD772_03070, partial [Pseudohongiellaceae bacterium]
RERAVATPPATRRLSSALSTQNHYGMGAVCCSTSYHPVPITAVSFDQASVKIQTETLCSNLLN